MQGQGASSGRRVSGHAQAELERMKLRDLHQCISIMVRRQAATHPMGSCNVYAKNLPKALSQGMVLPCSLSAQPAGGGGTWVPREQQGTAVMFSTVQVESRLAATFVSMQLWRMPCSWGAAEHQLHTMAYRTRWHLRGSMAWYRREIAASERTRHHQPTCKVAQVRRRKRDVGDLHERQDRLQGR